MSTIWHPDIPTFSGKGMQFIDLKKLREAPDPTFSDVMDTLWSYQKEGFQKQFETILNQEKKRDLYYIAWMFKPRMENKRMIQSTFFILDIEPPRMLAVTLFKVNNKTSQVDVVWALPYDAPVIAGIDNFLVKLHPKIAESVAKSKGSYVFNNPLDDLKGAVG